MAKEIKTLNFGIMVRGNNLPIWQYRSIKKLLEISGVALKLIIYDKNPGGLKNQLKNYFSIRKSLWFLYLFIMSIRSKATKSVDCKSLYKNIEHINCKTINKGKFSQYFKDSDVSNIKKYKLDFILRFGFNIIRGDIHNAAKFGIWSFHHDDEIKYRGGPPGFWEIFYKENTTGSILQRLTDRLDGGVILKKAYFKTHPIYIKNRDFTYLQTSEWPAYVVKKIMLDSQFIDRLKPSSTKAKIYLAPSNSQFLKYFFNSRFLIIKKFIKSIFYIDVWNIGVWNKPIKDSLSSNISNVIWYPLDKKSFIADPFGIKAENNGIYVFYEKFPFGSNKGLIETVFFDVSLKKWGKPKTVIKENYHLSYPYIIKDKGEIYIIPESYQKNEVGIYKCNNFPDSWTYLKPLIGNLKGIDSTPFEFNGKWWMFSSIKDKNPKQNLNLFFSDGLKEKWTPHPLNPVKTNITSARCAGTIFTFKNILYRPSMDYSEKIEGKITLNKIIKLSETEFEEVFVKQITPPTESEFRDKIHTLSELGEITLIDGCKETLIFKHPLYLIHQIKMIFNFLKKK